MFFQVSHRGLLALRWQFAVLFVIVWNGLNLLAIKLNGRFGPYERPEALFVVAAACLGTAAAAASIVASDRVREVVTAPSRRHYYEASIFLLIAAISAVLGCAALLSAVRMQSGG